MKNTIKYGGVELEVKFSSHSLVPTDTYPVSLPTEDKKALAIAVKENLPCLLVGEAGTGKTSAIRELACLLKQPYHRINMTGYKTPDELIGSKSVKDGNTYYENGEVTLAMSTGGILVIDEINSCSPDTLFVLHGLLDEDRQVTLPNGDVIRPHKDFRVFATMNPEYEGTKTLNKAFIDRFPIILFIDTLAPKKETELIVKKAGIAEDLASKLVTTATIARKEYAENKISTFVSTRSLLNVAKLITSGLEPKKAYITTVAQKATGKEEQKILIDYYLQVFKEASGDTDDNTPIVVTRGELNRLEERVKSASDREYARDRTISELQVANADLQLKVERTHAQVISLEEFNKKVEDEKTALTERLNGLKYIEGIINSAKDKGVSC